MDKLSCGENARKYVSATARVAFCGVGELNIYILEMAGKMLSRLLSKAFLKGCVVLGSNLW